MDLKVVLKATNLKKPLKGMQVLVKAYENKNATTTTIIVEVIATNKLL